MDHQLHYHIRWSGKAALDWECFDRSADAEASARELVRRDETYTIEEHGEGCPRCRAAMNLKSVHTQANPAIKYPWQQLVFDAFLESRPEIVPQKINVAERAISARLCDSTPTDLEEQIALRDALQALHSLLPKQAESDEAIGRKGGRSRLGFWRGPLDHACNFETT